MTGVKRGCPSCGGEVPEGAPTCPSCGAIPMRSAADTLALQNFASRLTPVLSANYSIERPLGRGGMATVYLARDARHRRSVAIKVFLPELSPLLGPDRFLREIEIAAQLSHPHIVPL